MPTAEGSGTVVLSVLASSSKDEMTIGGLSVIDGIDVVATLVPEEDVWQFEATETCTSETQMQDGEQESIAAVDYETSMNSKSKWRPMNQKCDRHQARKSCQELLKKRKDPNSSATRCRLCATEVNTGESISDTFAATPRLKFERLVLSWTASYKRKLANASMIIAVFDISVAFFHRKVRKVIYVVPPKDLRKKVKIWRLFKIIGGTRDASQVFATYVKEGLNNDGFQMNALMPCLYWSTMLEALDVYWRDDFIFGIPDVNMHPEDFLNDNCSCTVGFSNVFLVVSPATICSCLPMWRSSESQRESAPRRQSVWF